MHRTSNDTLCLVAGLVLGLVLAPSTALAAPPSLEVAGAIPKTGSLTLQQMEAMKPEKASWTDRGEKREIEGVSLGKLLAAQGFEPGPMGKSVPPPDKRPGYKKVLVVTAKDGFQAVFSCAELTEGMGATRALLVWKIDGKPLPPEQAPFRLIVLTDQEPSRSSYAVTKLEVVDLRAATAAPQPVKPASP